MRQFRLLFFLSLPMILIWPSNEIDWQAAKKVLEFKTFDDLKISNGTVDNGVSYDKAFTATKVKYQLRMKYFPYSEILDHAEALRQLTGGQAQETEDQAVVSIFENELQHVTGAKAPAISTVSPDYAKKTFNANAVLTARIDDGRRFGGEYKQLLVFMVHRHGVGNLLVYILQDDMAVGEKAWLQFRQIVKFKSPITSKQERECH